MLTPVQQFAGHYIRNMGFQVVPLEGKACLHKDWPKRVYGIGDFNGHHNIGIRTVNGLVALDDDHETPVLECAEAFFPKTGAVFGRPSYRRRKYLYLCPELTTPIVWRNLAGEIVMELRVNHQEMSPPSIHPDTKERLAWDGLLQPPLQVRLEDLLQFARCYWASRLLGEHWPTQGRRHDMRMACAGLLLKTLAVPDMFAVRVLEWACRLGGSDAKGVKDALTSIQTTKRCLERGEPFKGAPTIYQLLSDDDTGRRLVARLREGFGKNNFLEEAVEELNERYFVVDVGSDTVVGEEVTRDNWTDLQFRSFEDFKKKLIKRDVEVGRKKDDTPIRRPLADLWLRHPQGSQFNKLVYAPPGTSANPDVELLRAVRPALARVPGSLLAVVSSPYARRGVLYSAWQRHHDKPNGAVVLIHASTADLNPTFDRRAIETAYEEDPASAAAEYGAQFRSDVEGFITRDALDASVIPGRLELPIVMGISYTGFLDFSGGAGADSATAAVAHIDKRDGVVFAILDGLREVKPPFSPEQVCADFSAFFKTYGISRVTSDRWAGQFPVEGMRRHGITVEPSARPKSDIYKEFLPLLNSGRVELLDHPRLLTQLASLERRTARGGRDSIDHPPGGHDDVANAACGALVSVGVSTRKPLAMSDDVLSQEESDAKQRAQQERFTRQLLQQGSVGFGD